MIQMAKTHAPNGSTQAQHLVGHLILIAFNQDPVQPNKYVK